MILADFGPKYADSDLWLDILGDLVVVVVVVGVLDAAPLPPLPLSFDPRSAVKLQRVLLGLRYAGLERSSVALVLAGPLIAAIVGRACSGERSGVLLLVLELPLLLLVPLELLVLVLSLTRR